MFWPGLLRLLGNLHSEDPYFISGESHGALRPLAWLARPPLLLTHFKHAHLLQMISPE